MAPLQKSRDIPPCSPLGVQPHSGDRIGLLVVIIPRIREGGWWGESGGGDIALGETRLCSQLEGSGEDGEVVGRELAQSTAGTGTTQAGVKFVLAGGDLDAAGETRQVLRQNLKAE